jgi:hypothetical protein
LPGAFHATRHDRSDGCAGNAAAVVPAHASANDASVTATDGTRAMTAR